MGDLDVARWRQRGAVSMWKNRDPRNPHWNLTADERGCAALLDLLDRMEGGQWSSKKRMSLRKPVITADHGGDRPFRSARHLTIKYPKDRVPDDHWDLREEKRQLLLEVGLLSLRELREAVVDLKSGGGDYAIGGDYSPLWIWWYCDDPDAGEAMA